jgi:hypothetical protein
VSSLFTSQTPVTGNNFDNAPATLATTLVFAVSGTVTYGRFYAPSNPTGTFTHAFWRVDISDIPDGSGSGFLLGTAGYGTVTAGAWNNSAAFSSPISVTAGQAYKTSVRTSTGSYPSTANFFTSASLVNGSISGPRSGVAFGSSGTFYNGSYAEDTTSYPNKGFNETCYFVDVEFVPSSAARRPVVIRQAVGFAASW